MSSYAVTVRLPSGTRSELKLDAANSMAARELAEAQFGKGTVIGCCAYEQSSTSIFEEKAKADQEWSDRQDRQRAESQRRATQYSSSSVSAPSVSVPQWSNSGSSSSYSTSSGFSSDSSIGFLDGGAGFRLLMGTVTTAVAFAMPGEFNWLVALSGFITPLLITYIVVIALLIAAWPTIVAIAKAIMSITLVGVLKTLAVIILTPIVIWAIIIFVQSYHEVAAEEKQKQAESE